MAISEAERLRAPGVDVTLAGKVYPLIFDFEALCLLEDEMGGLDVFAQRLADNKQRLRTVRAGMVAALAHTGMSRPEIVAKLEYNKVRLYLEAMTEAFIQALPEPDPNESPKAPGSPNGSPGDAITTSPRSPSGAAIASSGG